MTYITLKNVCENMLTHVHKVIHKVVGTFATVLRGREKWRLPGSDQTLASGAPVCPVSSDVSAWRGRVITGRWCVSDHPQQTHPVCVFPLWYLTGVDRTRTV
jgi:hypothetical protein